MIMLIPFAMVLFLTVVLASISAVDIQQANRNEFRQMANAVAFHHELVVDRHPTLNGLVVLPERNTVSPMEGLTSFVARSGSTTYVLTWPRRFTVGADSAAASLHPASVATSVSSQAERILSTNMYVGVSDQGPLVRIAGLNHRIGAIAIPFAPPAALGAPIIVTQIQGN